MRTTLMGASWMETTRPATGCTSVANIGSVSQVGALHASELKEEIAVVVEQGAAKCERTRVGVVVPPRAFQLLQLMQDVVEVVLVREFVLQDRVRVEHVVGVVASAVHLGWRLPHVVDVVDLHLDDPSASSLDDDRSLPKGSGLGAAQGSQPPYFGWLA